MPNCLIYRPRRIVNRKSVTSCVSLYGGFRKFFGKVPLHLRRYFNFVILSCNSVPFKPYRELVRACLAPCGSAETTGLVNALLQGTS
jgi:hypothetical protein